jgi:pimeloyl-ACP methyl ester carboxylesterase
MSQEALDRLRLHDPRNNPVELAAMSDDELLIAARNRETLALITWEPYMHNPKLRHRLHRVEAPVLLLRGASDGIVSADYLSRYGALFANSRIETIAQAGHLPQVEQREVTAKIILQFLATEQMAKRAGAKS